MASSLVIHIAAGEDKHTEILSQDRIRIGASEDCELRLRASSLPLTDGAPAPLLELTRINGHFRVKDFDQSLDLTHNGKPLVINQKIKDGDEVRLESVDLSLSFFPVRDLPALTGTRHQVAPFIETAAIESAATTRRDDAKVFLREFTRELVREIKTSTKIVTLLIALALVGGVLYLGFGLYNELKRSRRAMEEQRAQLDQAKVQLSKMGNEIENTGRSNQIILDSLSLAPKLRSDFGGGVCMILSVYYFAESGTGRPLRYPEPQTNEEGTNVQNSDERLQLTPEGNGTIAEFEAVGTGFYVGDGYVLTNRHVAQPWLADERVQILTSSVGGQPRLKKLLAYFPDHTQPITLKFKIAAQQEDVAVCTFDVKEAPPNIPVLPLDNDSEAVAIGKTVVMMGYPNGPERLLALREDAEAYMIRARCGASLGTLLGCLSEKNRIQPLTTQGNITDLDIHRVVYDARTAEGGSGAPLFGQSGRVIGVNFAIFPENTASNFAVPIRYGYKLLARAGWKSPEPAPSDANQNSNSNANQTATRTGSAAANIQR